MSDVIIFQVPIDITKAGIYEWTLTVSNAEVTGHVVVRGVQAAPIGNHPWPAGSEAWFSKSPGGGGGSPATLTLELVELGDPTDKTFQQKVDAIVQAESPMGTTPEVPTWQSGAPLGKDPLVLTLTAVSNGVQGHDYAWLYEHISAQLPFDGQTVEMPTWYTDDTKIQTVFGGDPAKSVPVQQGIRAKLVEVTSGDGGYPKAGWHWFGRKP